MKKLIVFTREFFLSLSTCKKKCNNFKISRRNILFLSIQSSATTRLSILFNRESAYGAIISERHR